MIDGYITVIVRNLIEHRLLIDIGNRVGLSIVLVLILGNGIRRGLYVLIRVICLIRAMVWVLIWEVHLLIWTVVVDRDFLVILIEGDPWCH